MSDCEALSISLPDQLFLSLVAIPFFEGMLCLDCSNPRAPLRQDYFIQALSLASLTVSSVECSQVSSR